MYRTLLAFCLLFQLSLQAQFNFTYSMGGISLDNNTTSTFSGPLVLTPTNECLKVSNGVIVFSATKLGSSLFNSDCNVSNSTTNYFTLSPNPSRGFTKLYSLGTLEQNIPITVLFYDLKGMLINRIETYSNNLKSGLDFSTFQWASGIYFINIIYQNKTTTLKLLNTL